MGTIFAHDGKQYARWRNRNRPRKRSLSDAQLEAAIRNIGKQFPGHVIHQPVG